MANSASAVTADKPLFIISSLSPEYLLHSNYVADINLENKTFYLAAHPLRGKPHRDFLPVIISKLRFLSRISRLTFTEIPSSKSYQGSVINVRPFLFNPL
jgi:hypothetical protein